MGLHGMLFCSMRSIRCETHAEVFFLMFLLSRSTLLGWSLRYILSEDCKLVCDCCALTLFLSEDAYIAWSGGLRAIFYLKIAHLCAIVR